MNTSGMTHRQKKRAYNQHWFKCKRKVRHRRWIAAAWHCVQLWTTGDGPELGWATVYPCRRGLKWYDEETARPHYHVGRKGRMKREKEAMCS